MKKLAQLLFILSCVSYTYADSMLPKIDRQKECCVSPCVPDFNFECCKGPRGKRGHRGHRGRTGATGATGAAATGLNELFLNALMMTHSLSEGPVPMNFFFAYGVGSTGAPIGAWILDSPNVAPDFIGVNFDIPDDLDNTQPVNVVLYFVIPNSGGQSSGSQAKILLQADYKFSGGLAGIEAPATGFVTSSVSPDFAIIEPAISAPFDTNVVIITTTIALNPSFIVPGQWVFFEISRILPATDDYTFPIYLSDLSFQYSRLNS